MSWLDSIAANSVPLLLGGVSGGLLGAVALAVTWWWDSRRRTATELLKDGLAIHSALEAWILVDPTAALSSMRPSQTLVDAKEVGLVNVEMRLVLDQSPWNAPTTNFFGIVDGKRTWIVRDVVVDGDSHPRTSDVINLRPFPAIVSSKGLHELSGWIERVASLCFWGIWPFRRGKRRPIAFFLSPHDISSLYALVASVRSEAQIVLLGSRLSDDAKAFLSWHEKKYPTKHHTNRKI